jgi:hypothetical protein
VIAPRRSGLALYPWRAIRASIRQIEASCAARAEGLSLSVPRDEAVIHHQQTFEPL